MQIQPYSDVIDLHSEESEKDEPTGKETVPKVKERPLPRHFVQPPTDLVFTQRRQKQPVRNTLLFTPRTNAQEQNIGSFTKPHAQLSASMVSFTPRNTVNTVVEKDLGTTKKPNAEGLCEPTPTAKVRNVAGLLSFTPRHPQSATSQNVLSFKQRTFPATGEQPIQKEPQVEPDDALFGEWEVVDEQNPALLARIVKNVCEVRFKDDTVQIKNSTTAAAKASVSNRDFRSFDVKNLSETINQFYNRCEKDLFASIKKKMFVCHGKILCSTNYSLLVTFSLQNNMCVCNEEIIYSLKLSRINYL